MFAEFRMADQRATWSRPSKSVTLDENTSAEADTQASAGRTNFLVPCGTTGESPTHHSPGEHLRVWCGDHPSEEAKGKVPVPRRARAVRSRKLSQMARETRAQSAPRHLVGHAVNYTSMRRRNELYHLITNTISRPLRLPIILYKCRRRYQCERLLTGNSSAASRKMKKKT